MIAWKYLDTNAATIAAIRDYENMQAIIDDTPDIIREVSAVMVSPKNQQITGMPSAHNPNAGQEQLVSRLDRLDVLEERERVAKAYMAWFIPAWDRLTEQEQLILTEFFMVSNQFRNGARGRLASKLNYTERHIDRLRADAIQKLQTLLFG